MRVRIRLILLISTLHGSGCNAFMFTQSPNIVAFSAPSIFTSSTLTNTITSKSTPLRLRRALYKKIRGKYLIIHGINNKSETQWCPRIMQKWWFYYVRMLDDLLARVTPHAAGGVRLLAGISDYSALSADGTAALLLSKVAADGAVASAAELLASHWTRDALCATVGLVGAAAWIGVGSE